MKAEGIRLPTVDRALIADLSIHATDTADMVGAQRGPGGQRIRVVSKGRLCHGTTIPTRNGHREAGIRLPQAAMQHPLPRRSEVKRQAQKCFMERRDHTELVKHHVMDQ